MSITEERGDWRLRLRRAARGAERTGNRREDVRGADARHGRGVRARDRGLAAGLAHVPARLGTVRIALVCPYAFDDPGGVQTHVRELAEHLRARGPRGRGARAVRARRAQPSMSARSAAPSTSRTTHRTRRSTRARGPRRRVAAELAAFATATWSTCTSRSTPSTVDVGDPRREASPVVATFHSGADRSRLYDLAAPVLRRVARRIAVRIAVSEAAAAFARARIGGAFEIVPERRGRRAVRRRDARRPRARREAAVRRPPRRAQGVPGGGGRVRAARRRASATSISWSIGDGPDRAALDALPPELRSRVRLLGTSPTSICPRTTRPATSSSGPAVGGESFGMVLVEAMAAGPPRGGEPDPRATRRWCATASTGSWSRRVIRRPLAEAAARVLDDPALAHALARRRARARAVLRLVRRDRAAGGAYARATGHRRRPRYHRRRAGVSGSSSGSSSSSCWAPSGRTTGWCGCKVRVDNGWSQIDVQLRRRYDLIPNLVETVQGYAAHEKEVFETRHRGADPGRWARKSVGEQAQAENQLTAGLGRLIAVAENYPDLKANENFLALQEELHRHRVEDRVRPAVLQRPGDAAEHRDPVVPLEPARHGVPFRAARVLRHRGRRPAARSRWSSRPPCTRRSRPTSARASCSSSARSSSWADRVRRRATSSSTAAPGGS